MTVTRVSKDKVEECLTRVGESSNRLSRYDAYAAEFYGTFGSGQNDTVRGSYADGRPALQYLENFQTRLQGKRGAPNLLKPIVEDAVSVAGVIPTITFDPASDSEEDLKQAVVASRAVRGQWELSQMEIKQPQAVQYLKLYGEVLYTLDPLRPKDIDKKGDPFALPGVYINVIDPRYAFPSFGTGREQFRIKDVYLWYPDVPYRTICKLYPEMDDFMREGEKASIVIYYDDDERCTDLWLNEQAYEVEKDHHDLGFCPAEWAINKLTGTAYGMSELDQTSDLHRNVRALFNMAMGSAIYSVFPMLHVHNAEHAGRAQFGPGAIIETSEDGKVELLTPGGNSQVAAMLLDLSSKNLMQQAGVSPIRAEGMIDRSNVSGRSVAAQQAPMESRLQLSQTLLGSSLEWLNSKIAMILFKDPGFETAQMSVYGADFKGQRSTVTFTGKDLGGLWRNRVKWTSLLGHNVHEELVMLLQLKKEGLLSGRAVLEGIGREDPERLLEEARSDQMVQAKLQAALAAAAQGGPGGPGGAPGPSGPTDAAEQGAALNAGALPGGPGAAVPSGPSPIPGGGGGAGPVQPSPPPSPNGGGGGAALPGFAPLAQAPGGPAGAASPVPDIGGMVDQALTAADPKLVDHVVSRMGLPDGILVTVDDQRYIPAIRAALKPVAEEIAGPSGVVKVELVKPLKASK